MVLVSCGVPVGGHLEMGVLLHADRPHLQDRPWLPGQGLDGLSALRLRQVDGDLTLEHRLSPAVHPMEVGV